MTMHLIKTLALCISLLLTLVKSEELTGHMLPFGNHRRPTVVIDEFTKENIPRPQEFYKNYVKPSKAAIFRGAVVGSKAFNLWTDEYIREKYGENEVRLEGKREKQHFPPMGEKYLGRDTLRHFVDTYHADGNQVYIVSDLPKPMYRDIDVLPSVGACGFISKRIVEVDIWWSGGESHSIIHKDAFNQINCLVNGTKYWKLIEYKYQKQLYQHKEREEGYGGFSDVNAAKVDLKKFPMVKDIEWSNITINAGDCLFLPKSYYHQVYSTGTNNLAVSLLISRFDDRDSLDFSDCSENTDYKTAKTLDNYDVQHIWNGTGVMVMGRADLEEAYRNEYLSTTAELEDEGTLFDYEAWGERFINDRDDMMLSGDPKKAFEIMDKNDDGYLTSSDVELWTLQDLQAISNEIEPYEPSNQYKFEYSIITFDLVWRLLNAAKTQINILTKERWERIYTKRGGSKTFANEIFENLAKGKDNIVMKDVQPLDMWNALEKWVKYWAIQYSTVDEKPTKRAFGVPDVEDESSNHYNEL